MTQHDTLRALLDRHGRTFADEAGLTLRDKPSPLFGLLVLTSLLAANLDARLGIRAAAALRRAGYRTARGLVAASEDDRWQVLSDAKYLRKEQTARQLGELAEQAVERYGGDLRRMRDDAGGDPGRIGEAVQGFTGIGAVGADIFRREVQAVWSITPFADRQVLDVARTLGLPHSRRGLADLVGSEDLSVVGAALIRCDRAGDASDLRS